MLRTETTTVGGIEVGCTQFAPLRALRLMSKLGGIVAPVLGGVAGLESVKMTDDAKILIPLLVPVLGEVFAQLEDKDAAALTCEILAGSYAVAEGKKIDLNGHDKINLVFEGKLMALLQALAFAVKVNFGEFFGGAQAGGADES